MTKSNSSKAAENNFSLGQPLSAPRGYAVTMKLSAWYRSLPEFDRLTGIDSLFAATSTLDDIRLYFWTELPDGWESELVRRMHAVFARHKLWRQRAIREDDAEFVRVFLRRWTAELLFKYKHPLYHQLPRGYKYGEPLPALSLPQQRELAAETARRRNRRQLSERKARRKGRTFVHGCELLMP